MSSNSKRKEAKNIKALFSVICLCVVSLGLIIYFSTTTKEKNNPVVEPTTIVETTEVQRAVTVKEATTKEHPVETQPQTTEPTSMPMNESNTPYKSYYKYPLGEATQKGYSQELVYDATMGDYRAHTAVDFTGVEGDKIIAINDGLVLDVFTDNKYGLCVEIDHGGKFVVKYCGLESASVKKGDFIEIGNQIGTLGKIPCEAKDGVHLHISATLEGESINPLDVMGKTE